MQFKWKKFTELSVAELYAILELRSSIFVVEQNCLYLDLDYKDQFALHLMGCETDKLAAYLRLFLPSEVENYLVFGRVVTANFARSKGYGKQLMQELINYCDFHFPSIEIKCSAQHYLKQFYQGFGFQAYTEIYMEDGIPHIGMCRKN